MKAKAILLGGEYYLLPPNAPSAKEFSSYLTANFNRFITMTKLDDDPKAFPFFLESKKKEVYVNVHHINQFEEVEIDLVPDAKESENSGEESTEE
ncbi:MAG: hypothetical protein K5917_04705 [Clostridiales bacterium]|nr:hypothetical protein [Clostridiales bacterium]